MPRFFLVLLTFFANVPFALAWDPIGDLTDPGRRLRNAEKEARATLDAAANAERELLVQSNAPIFEVWLNQSRADSMADPMPMPKKVRQELGDFYPTWVLDRASYKVGDGGIFNLGNLSIQYGGSAAVTLNDVIVFLYPEDAATNTVLWSHELKHIQQFSDWGVHDFAVRYLRDWNAVEDEAYAAQRAFQSGRANAPAAGDFDGNGVYDGVTLLTNTIVVRLNDSDSEIRTFINSDYNTRLGRVDEPEPEA